MAAYNSMTINLTGDESPERLSAAEVSYNLMSLLGIRPEIGREFRADEDIPGAPGTVILSYGLWLRRFSGDRDIIGQVVHLDKEPYTIIGVAPKGFEFPDISQLWIPLRLSPTENRDVMAYWVIGRMRENISLDQAYAGILDVDARVIEEYEGSEENLTVGIISLKSPYDPPSEQVDHELHVSCCCPEQTSFLSGRYGGCGCHIAARWIRPGYEELPLPDRSGSARL